MKFIHCADIHLGSAMVSLDREKAEIRKGELRDTFAKMAEYASENGISAVLLSGDVFDSDRPSKRDKEHFYSVVRAYPQITFFYLRGNHDSRESYTENLSNLKCFTDKWISYTLGDTVISGAELTAENCSAVYSSLRLEKSAKNIVMLHGAEGDADGRDRVNLAKLKDKNIDYLALGHIHSFSGFKQLDKRGVYAYSGCLEGRGFDEDGQKGFIVIDSKDFKGEFVPFATRTVVKFTVDVSSATDGYTAYLAVKSAVNCKKSDFLRVELAGEITFDGSYLKDDISSRLSRENYFCVSVKDKTVRKFDVAELEGDVSLRGEFIRGVLASDEYSDSEKQQIISAGLRALAGGEV